MEVEEAEEDCSCCCVELSVGLVWLGGYHSRTRERQRERKKDTDGRPLACQDP